MIGGLQPLPKLQAFVLDQGLAHKGEAVRWTALTGGVSSDIWRVDLPGRSLCIKAALPKLKVVRDWRAPVSRNVHEWDWLCFAQAHCPGIVPRPLAHDPAVGAFAMEYLDAQHHPVWKELLIQGQIQPMVAQQTAANLAFLQSRSAGDPEVRQRFDTSDIFYAIRLEPYFTETGRQHASVRSQLDALVDQVLATRVALVHGDISPKNILVGPQNPIFLDAECAWYGDPAFDAAFCLNHLLLKCLFNPAQTDAYLACFEAFATTYLGGVQWEARDQIESRLSRLLPALLLARIDGKSPVEYLTQEADKDLVRAVALPLISRPPQRVAEIALTWRTAVESRSHRP